MPNEVILKNYVSSPEITTEFSFILRPSPLEGIGVFATHNIKQGTYLLLFVEDEASRVIKRQEWCGHPYFERYCVEIHDELYGPGNFARMSVGWYLNHGVPANAGHDNYRYYALRDIQAGEEILIDYATIDQSTDTGTTSIP